MTDALPTTPKRSSGWLKKLLLVGGIGVAVAFGVSYFVMKSKLGTKLSISEDESVYYAVDATKEEAQRLGDALKERGYFDGKDGADVLLRKEDGKTILGFIVQDDIWTRTEMLEAFESLARQVAPSVGGLPVTLRLLDDGLDTKFERELRDE